MTIDLPKSKVDRYIGGKTYQVHYPVEQYIGPDIRGLQYKDYVLTTETTKDMANHTSGIFVWRNGEWTTRRLQTTYGLRKQIELPKKYPRMMYPNMDIQEGDFIINRHDLHYDGLVRLFRVKYVYPAGKLSQIRGNALEKQWGEDAWHFYPVSYDVGSDWNNYQKITLPELLEVNPTVAQRLIEASLYGH